MEKVEDITLDILSWLPAKSIMRFKCISKAWNTWLGHPNFVKLHIARSQSRPSATRLLFELDVDLDYNINYPARKQRPLEGFSLEPTRCFHYKDMFICSNHCNGLVCLYSSNDTQVYLYNVTTREIKALPFPVNHVKYPTVDPQLFLGFDRVTEKYKLLHSFEETNTRRLVIKILTLGTNSWRSIIRPTNCFLSRNRRIYLDGVLYSINGPPTYFNFREEKFGNFPHIPDSCRMLNMMQTALWGKLVIRSHSRSNYHWGREDGNIIYDDVNKVFTKLVDYPDSEKIALIETETIDRTKYGNTVLATASIISAPTSLLPPYLFQVPKMDRDFPASFQVISDFLTDLLITNDLTGTLALYDYTLANLKNDPEFLHFAEEVKEYHFQQKLGFIRTRSSRNKLVLMLKAMQDTYDIRQHEAHRFFKKVDWGTYLAEFDTLMSVADRTGIWDREYYQHSFRSTVAHALVDEMDAMDAMKCEIYEYTELPRRLLDWNDQSVHYFFINQERKRVLMFKFGTVHYQANNDNNNNEGALPGDGF